MGTDEPLEKRVDRIEERQEEILSLFAHADPVVVIDQDQVVPFPGNDDDGSTGMGGSGSGGSGGSGSLSPITQVLREIRDNIDEIGDTLDDIESEIG
ncbi:MULTISPECIES: hypothetical protein [Halobaculum]|uniref:Uncharacterized protein n=2 Tax=Halobaculum TaxID=43927 RepID=A0A8T8W9M8_9EURY|nr:MULTISPECIES: hypothetical protein [Halobaculum]QZP36526.1 hypothetical protein K6T50_09360 [Halobaculum magnesiiphilum]QZY01503.1 hypothetical protein K6T36_09135 [Halobaculum roseum]